MGHFCVNCGQALEPKTVDGREVEACPRDGFVLWRDPKVATAVVIESSGGIVLGRRGIEPGYGLWCLPGGFVNADEDPASAAVRECLEEICVEVELTGLLGVFHIGKTDASSMIGIAYSAHLKTGAEPRAGDEMLEVGVFDVAALPSLAFPSHADVLAEYVRSPASRAAAALLNGGAAVPSAGQPSRQQGTPKSPRTS